MTRKLVLSFSECSLIMKRTHGVSAEDKINGTINLDTTLYYQKQRKSNEQIDTRIYHIYASPHSHVNYLYYHFFFFCFRCYFPNFALVGPPFMSSWCSTCLQFTFLFNFFIFLFNSYSTFMSCFYYLLILPSFNLFLLFHIT